jgi:hypothetical protein
LGNLLFIVIFVGKTNIMNNVLRSSLADLKCGDFERELAFAVCSNTRQLDALCTYSGGQLPHGQDSAHRRWIEDLCALREGLKALERDAKAQQEAISTFIEQLEGAPTAPDWEHPEVRSMLRGKTAPFHRAAAGVSARKRPPHRIPQLTPYVLHQAMVVRDGELFLFELNRVAQARWMVTLNNAIVAGSERSPKVSWQKTIRAIPKHIDGKKDYALVKNLDLVPRGCMRRGDELWQREGGQWRV